MTDTRTAGDIESAVRLTPQQQENLVAVAFDTNAFGKGRPNLQILRHHAERISRSKLETWIHELVVWELAEHVASDWEAQSTVVRNLNSALCAAGLEPVKLPNYESKEATIDAVVENIRAVEHLKIIPLSAESAIAGLKHQVLLRPPGRRKEGIKTGASDAAWLRDIAATAGGIDRVLLVTADRDITAACAELGWAKPLTRKIGQLARTLSSRTPATRVATNIILQYVLSELPDEDEWDHGSAKADQSDLVRQIELAASEMDDWFAATLTEEDPDTRVLGANLTKITRFAGLSDVHVETDVEIDDTDPDNTLTLVYASAHFVADAEATVNRLSTGRDTYVDTMSTTGLEIECILEFALQNDAVVACASLADAAISGSANTFATFDEAVSRLNRAMTFVPGIFLPSGWYDEPSIDLTIDGIDSHVHVSRIDHQADRKTTFSFNFRGTTAKLVFEPWESTGRRMWAYLLVDDALVDAWERNPVLSIPAWLIRQVT